MLCVVSLCLLFRVGYWLGFDSVWCLSSSVEWCSLAVAFSCRVALRVVCCLLFVVRHSLCRDYWLFVCR